MLNIEDTVPAMKEKKKTVSGKCCKYVCYLKLTLKGLKKHEYEQKTQKSIASVNM